MISNAISAVDEPFFGVLAENGDLIYSRHPSDFRESADKTVFVDGGRGRIRHDLIHEVVKLGVLRDRVVVVPRENRKPACEVPFTAELDLDLGRRIIPMRSEDGVWVAGLNGSAGEQSSPCYVGIRQETEPVLKRLFRATAPNEFRLKGGRFVLVPGFPSC